MNQHPQLKTDTAAVNVPTTVPLSPVLTFKEQVKAVKAKAKSVLQQILGRTRIGKPKHELPLVKVNRNYGTGKKWSILLLNKRGQGVEYLPASDHVVLIETKFKCKLNRGCGGSEHSGEAVGYLVSTSPIDTMPTSAKPVKFDTDDGHFVCNGQRVDGGKYLVLDNKDTRIIK